MSGIGTVLVVLAAVGAGLVLAALVRRRRPDPPTQVADHRAPVQLDRTDFPRPDAPWIVVVFSSSTCDACAGVLQRAEALRSSAVEVAEVEVGTDQELHDRYEITAVPTTVIADQRGVVAASFLGPVSSTHLWAAVAEARDPGSVPGGCARTEDDRPSQ